MWPKILLGELIQPAPTIRARTGSHPVLSMTMRYGLVDQEQRFKKRIASLDTSHYKIVKRGELVVGFPIDEGVLGFQEFYSEAIVSPAYHVWRLRDIHQVDRRYLERYLRSNVALAFYSKKLRSTTERRRAIPDDIFLTLPIPLPSFAEQRRITAILDLTDNLRQKRQNGIDLLDKMPYAMFVNAFGDPPANPKGWPRRTIGEIGKVVTGNTPSRANASYYGSEIEWIKSDNINNPN